jgi:4-hydroxy 2-oxovalerate aldolase
MSPQEAARVSEKLLEGWNRPLGFHPHNNRGQAFLNMFAAIEAGVSWGDSTVRGMGRGAGNLQTEIFLAELSERYGLQSDLAALEDIFSTFDDWLDQYKWGPNLYYHLAADWGIHPTFIQELLQDRRGRSGRIIPILKNLKKMSASSYSRSVLQHAIMPSDEGQRSEGSWDASNWLGGREVLLVASGPSTKLHLEGIKLFIARYSPMVVTINRNELLQPAIVDAVIASNPTSVALESSFYTELKCPLIAPVNRLRHVNPDIANSEAVLDYGLIIEGHSFKIGKKECRLKWDLTAAYGLAVLTQAGASKINLVGFDGHEDDKEKHEEMAGIFALYQEGYPDIPMISLTPTTYPIQQGSIYER